MSPEERQLIVELLTELSKAMTHWANICAEIHDRIVAKN